MSKIKCKMMRHHVFVRVPLNFKEWAKAQAKELDFSTLDVSNLRGEVSILRTDYNKIQKVRKELLSGLVEGGLEKNGVC